LKRSLQILKKYPNETFPEEKSNGYIDLERSNVNKHGKSMNNHKQASIFKRDKITLNPNEEIKVSNLLGKDVWQNQV